MFTVMQIDFVTYREDFTNAAVFTELRSRIPQVFDILLDLLLIAIGELCYLSQSFNRSHSV